MTQNSMILLNAGVGADWIGLDCDGLNASIDRIIREDRRDRISISENNMKVEKEIKIEEVERDRDSSERTYLNAASPFD